MRKIAVVTGSRADYGLLYNTINKISMNKYLKLQFIVAGAHLSTHYGETIDEILNDGIKIDWQIDIPISNNDGVNIGIYLGESIIEFCKCFQQLSPDITLILGDRYEIFAAASAAMCMHIPIAHISGGESSEGCIDEQIRHAVTKMAHIHFTANEVYRNRVISMGEEDWRVFNVGDPGVENIKKLEPISKEDLEKELNIKLSEKAFLINYHSVTNEIDELRFQLDELLKALGSFDCQKIFTYPNSDEGGDYIVERIENYVNQHMEDSCIFKNLGRRRYLNLLRYIKVMVGNSSSGIIEAPSFKVPVINIGDRQNGRLKSDNIIDCKNSCEDIVLAIEKALQCKDFNKKIEQTVNCYESKDTSGMIVNILSDICIDKKLIIKRLNL